MEKMQNNSTLGVQVCRRCEEEKRVNQYGLCKVCDQEVDKEYRQLYGNKTMDH